MDLKPKTTAAYGGARPKTGGKYESGGPDVNRKGQGSKAAGQSAGKKGGNGKSGGNGANSKKVVTRNGWTTVSSKKRKFEVSPRAAFPLKGRPTTVNRDVYVQGLDIGNGESEDDVIESVRCYCLDRGITPVFLRIIPVRYDNTRTGCRLTVSEEDYERVIRNSFWPANVKVRDWIVRPRDNGNEGDGGRAPSDNDE